MPRKSIQDIVPHGGKSIRNIPLPEHRPSHHVSKETYSEETKVKTTEYAPDEDTISSVREEFEARTERVKHRREFSIPWKPVSIVAGVIAVLGLAFFVTNLFYSAVVTVTPRTFAAKIQENLIAQRVPMGGDLPFDIKVLKETGSDKVSANGDQKVDKAASGTIVIYNNYSSAAQRLVKNTRFETPEGLIFRIQDSVTVPGKKGTVPGSVEALVVADATGDKYNVGLKDFTIPGFKGDPRYNAFYARSKTPLAGGFTGVIKIVADADRKQAQDDIQAKATIDLLQQLSTEKATSSIFWSKAYAVDCTPLPQETVSDSEALIKMDCSLTAALFDAETLSSFLAKKYVSGYAGEPIVINNLDSFAFAPAADFNPSAQSISFTLSGDATFEWLYDADKLKADLAGLDKSAGPAVIQRYPMIQKADISVRPVWRGSFPSSVNDITIKKSF